jgi:hypothetical protein
VVDLGEWHIAPAGNDVVAHDALVAKLRIRFVVAADDPAGQVVRELDLAGVRVDVEAAVLGRFELDNEPLGQV